MSLNGLWLVCADAGTLAEPVKPVDEQCKEICLKIRAAQLGTICILTTDDGYSVAVFSVIVAPPLAPVDWTVSYTSSRLPPEAAAIYSNPLLSHATPPPET
jgi:hypothetical protein